jgi:hypothetical protein
MTTEGVNIKIKRSPAAIPITQDGSRAIDKKGELIEVDLLLEFGQRTIQAPHQYHWHPSLSQYVRLQTIIGFVPILQDSDSA